jgi:acetyl-CoA carboxylase biotin carboxylase subunit
MHVMFADEAHCLGDGSKTTAYLDIEELIRICKATGAEAVHPGYGFLAERDDFAQRCEEEGITFIGPSSSVIRKMGHKTEAREAMIEAGVPIIPGSTEGIETDEQAIKIAEEVGYPIILKAAAGGGGKGMRICHDQKALLEYLPITRQEAQSFFGNNTVYIEKYIAVGRHVEVQLLGDAHGNIIHAGERDCSIQRRHQKLIEETPSPGLTPDISARLGAAAVKAAEFVGYTSAGTVEFLMDEEKNFYFMEMNTRIQVEHTVSEIYSGIDLIKAQILIAAGAGLRYTQEDIHFRGHAIECRVNAEDPFKGFMPCPGMITQLLLPAGPGVRVDTHIYPGYEISPYYDSMIAKVITWGEDRISAINKMKRALREFRIGGVQTNIPFHMAVLEHSVFLDGDYDTRYVNEYFANLVS